MINMQLERIWTELKRNCDYYFSQIIGYPLCPPEHVYLSSTGRCNLRCRMCSIPRPDNKAEDELTTEEAKKIIDQTAELKISHLTFSGGEPLLRNDIFDLIAYARDKKIKMADIITNGTLINEEVAKKLIKCGVTHITVSIDGLEKINDFIRGKGSFKKAVKALDLINKYRTDNIPSLGINFTIMNCNIGQILPMINLAKNKRCNIIVFQPVLPDNTAMQKRDKDALWVCEENLPKLKKAMGKVIELKKTMQGLNIHVNEKLLGMVTDYFSGRNMGVNLQCYESIVRIAISHNGDLWSCKGVYGNLRTGPLRKHWLSFKAKMVRQEIKQCQNHCLQSCVYLAELSDIYPGIRKFMSSVGRDEDNKEYAGRIFGLLDSYRTILIKKMAKYSRNLDTDYKRKSLDEFMDEIGNISETMGDLK